MYLALVLVSVRLMKEVIAVVAEEPVMNGSLGYITLTTINK